LQEAIFEDDAVPGAAITIQSFGDFLGYNPHLHILCSDGCFYRDGMFKVAPHFETKGLEEIFRLKLFKMLLSKGKITPEQVNMLMNWPPARRATFGFQRLLQTQNSAQAFHLRLTKSGYNIV